MYKTKSPVFDWMMLALLNLNEPFVNPPPPRGRRSNFALKF
jgi:hypothetical protein